MIIVCISDVHNKKLKNLPDGDVLVCAGDLTSSGQLFELEKYIDDMASLVSKYQVKITIAGNHDFCFEKEAPLAKRLITNAGWIYLQNSSFEWNGVNFHGAPQQPWFHDWAFNVKRGPSIAKYWEQIPANTDVLITHGPPYGVLDKVQTGDHVGCLELSAAVFRIAPKLHVFGHIHTGYGKVKGEEPITFVNASVCNEKYVPVNKPIVVVI